MARPDLLRNGDLQHRRDDQIRHPAGDGGDHCLARRCDADADIMAAFAELDQQTLAEAVMGRGQKKNSHVLSHYFFVNRNEQEPVFVRGRCERRGSSVRPSRSRNCERCSRRPGSGLRGLQPGSLDVGRDLHRRLKTARCGTNKLLCNKDAAHSEPNGPQNCRSAAAKFELATRAAPLRLFMAPSKTENDSSTPLSPNELR